MNVVLDKSQQSNKYTSSTYLLNGGIGPLIDDKHAIAHNKVMVIDGRIAITGSFNFTRAAEEKNAENLLIIDDPALAKRDSENWRDHAFHSQPYRSRTRAD